jgi:hypothetical protein
MKLMNLKMRSILGLCLLAIVFATPGCVSHKPKPYGKDQQLFLPGDKQLVWAVAPTINLSGEPQVDPLLQSDLLFDELQQVRGLKVIPVNSVVRVYASLHIEKVESEEQAYLVCQLLGCDGLVVPTITLFDPYDPPKVGASLQLFLKPGTYDPAPTLDPRELARAATPGPTEPTASPQGLKQEVGMFDAADGSTRDQINAYAVGRTDPNGPMSVKEIYVSMDRYCGFVYHQLLSELLADLIPKPKQPMN